MIFAVLIIVMTLALVVWVPRGARITYICCILLHTVVAAMNSASPHGMPGADTDARRFFNEAVDRSTGSSDYVSDLGGLLNGWNAYINVQGAVQSLAGPSLFLAHSVSVLGCGLCLVTLCGLWMEAGGSSKRVSSLMGCYTAVPSVALYHSFVLREVWQSLVVLLVARVAARGARRGVTFTVGVQVMLLMICGAFLHKVMPVLIIALIGGLLLTDIIQRRQTRRRGGGRLGSFQNVVVASLAIGVVGPLVGNSQFLSSAIEQGVAETTVDYATRNLKDARAEYGVLFSVERPWTLALAFLSYELEPLPGRVQSAADLVALMENFWRAWLFATWLAAARKIHWRGYSMSLIAGWFLIEVIWSVGTINWGTATRHHVPAYALLLVGSMLASEAARTIPGKARLAAGMCPFSK